MNNKSFLQTINILLRMQMCLIAVVIMVFIVTSYSSALEKQETELNNYLEIYTEQINNRIDRTDENLAEIVYDNVYLDILHSDNQTERQYAKMELFNEMLNMMKTNTGADVIAVAECMQKDYVTVKNSSVCLADATCLENFTMEYAKDGKQTGSWEILDAGDNTYIYKAMVKDKRAVLMFIETGTLLGVFPAERIENRDFLLTDRNGIILDGVGSQAEKWIGKNVEDLSHAQRLLRQKEIANGSFVLYISQDSIEAFRQISGNVVLLFIVLLTLLAFGFFFSACIRKKLLEPMEKMTNDMQYVKNDQYHLQITTESDSIEFRTLVDSFNKLMKEIMSLKIQFYEKQLDLAEAEQKYIRLQLRPHFFLNAMATIVSLSRSGRNSEIESYINALSRNIRYMFSSGLHTVPLQEEISHVENYFEMQEMKYPDCVMYFIVMPEEAKDWPVPQMLVHTLIENEYKYAVSRDRQLMVLIRLQIIMREGEKMLLLEIEDDGKGYPKDVIASINSGKGDSEDGSRIGIRSIYRLLQLLYDRENLFMIDNVIPHGALSRVYIPAKAVNERKMKEKGEMVI